MSRHSSPLSPVRDDLPLPSSSPSMAERSHAGIHANGHDDHDRQNGSEDEHEVVERPGSKLKLTVSASGSKPSGEPSKPERVQDDWQVAYVWAFLTKFGLKDRIRRLESLADFEQCLLEPVASRPDDVFEGVLVKFLGNLKPGLRNLDCSNIQSHLSNYINDQLLNSTEFTVWDRPWEHGEEDTGPCCSTADDRLVRGAVIPMGEVAADRATKNPIKQVEQKGGGLFELGWRERAALLRQLVDWQLARTDSIRDIVNESFTRKPVKKADKPDEPEDQGIKVKELGQDRDKNRIWAIDHSGRVWKSGNPFKRPCPLITLTSTRTELESLIGRYRDHGSQPAREMKGKKAKGRSAEQQKADRKFNAGLESERKLAEKLEGLIPQIEKEEARISRQRKRFLDALALAQAAEVRSTRTRRTTKKVDYTYDGFEEDDIAGPSKRSRRNDDAYDFTEDSPPPRSANHLSAVPGERQSARVRAQHIPTGRTAREDAGTDEHGGSSGKDHEDSRQSSPDKPQQAAPNGKKAAKGYAYVEEVVPFEQLGEEEKRAELERRRQDAERLDQVKREQEAGGGAGTGADGDVEKTVEGPDAPTGKQLSTDGGGAIIKTERQGALSVQEGPDAPMQVDEWAEGER